MKLKCSRCGKETAHYQASNGEVRCLVCGTVNKVIKKKVEVTFESDEEFNKTLNQEELVPEVDNTVVPEEV